MSLRRDINTKEIEELYALRLRLRASWQVGGRGEKYAEKMSFP